MPINNRKVSVIKIISGGQTGADRAALDFAIIHDILTAAGFPREDWRKMDPFRIAYQLQEMPSS